jgi:hypothetical protein
MKDEQALTVGRLLEEQSNLGRLRLVVLSACEIGLYETNRAQRLRLAHSGTLTIWGRGC